MSLLTVNQLQAQDAATNIITLSPGDSVYSPGSVVQVVETYITTPTAVSVPANVAGYTSIPDLSASITPKKLGSRIFVQVRWLGEWSGQTQNWDSMFGVSRNGVSIGENPGSTTAGSSRGIAPSLLTYYADDGNSTLEVCHFTVLDSPNSAALLTYQVFVNASAARTLFTNRVVNGAAGSNFEYGSSSITLWEIAQ